MNRRLQISMVLNVLLLLGGIVLFLRGPNLLPVSVPTAQDSPRKLADCRNFVLPAGKNDIIFLGDSLIQYGKWAELLPKEAPLNHGVAADWTDCVLYRLPATLASNPKRLVLLVGINDLMGGRKPEAIFQGLWRILAVLKRNSVPVTILSLLPTSANQGVSPGAIVALNEIYQKTAGEFLAPFVDVYSALASPDGYLKPEYSTDGLHLSDAGYRKLADTVAPHLK